MNTITRVEALPVVIPPCVVLNDATTLPVGERHSLGDVLSLVQLAQQLPPIAQQGPTAAAYAAVASGALLGAGRTVIQVEGLPVRPPAALEALRIRRRRRRARQRRDVPGAAIHLSPASTQYARADAAAEIVRVR